MFQNNGRVDPYAPTGYGYGPKPTLKATQPVTAEQSKLIHQNDDSLNMKIDKVESIKNSCTHKDPTTGSLAIMDNPDGTFTCRVCGETFNMVNASQEEIERDVNKVIDIIQTTKALYFDIPEKFAQEYFQVISLLKRLPQVFAKGATDFAMHEHYNGNTYPIYGQPGGNMDVFRTMGNMIAGTMPGYYPPQQPPTVGYYPPQSPPPVYYPHQQPPAAPGYPPQGYAQPAPPPPSAPPAYDMSGTIVPSWTQSYERNNAIPGYPPQQPPAQNGYQPAPPPMDNPMAYPTPPQEMVQPAQVPPVPQPANGPAPIEAPVQEVTQTKTIKV